MCRTRSPYLPARRRGSLTPLLIFMFIALLAIFGLAVNQARLWEVRAEMQVVADASADAAVGSLVGDDLLRGDPAYLPALLQTARTQAQLYATYNLVNGQPFPLDANLTNDPNGDIIFGIIDLADPSKTFTPATDVANTSNARLAAINSVRINTWLTQARGNAPTLFLAPFTGANSVDVRAIATVTLDRDVIGFRPATSQPLPIAPFALLSDPTAADLKSWEYQVETSNGVDQYSYDPVNKVFSAGSDGLREFHASLPLSVGDLPNANVAVLFIGTNDIAGATAQLGAGITATDLTTLGGQLALQANNRLTLPGSQLGPANPSADLTALKAALDALQASAQPVIWPLYIDFNGGNPELDGFVAARIVSVDPIVANQPLTFTLQPTMISTPSALTNPAQRGVNGVALVNPYICKVRFVE